MPYQTIEAVHRKITENSYFTVSRGSLIFPSKAAG